jgi:hypothetical protein
MPQNRGCRELAERVGRRGFYDFGVRICEARDYFRYHERHVNCGMARSHGRLLSSGRFAANLVRGIRPMANMLVAFHDI